MAVTESGEFRVEARAPGKVILSGEHAVVHGTSAVAAALGLYTTATIRPGMDDSCVLDLPQLGVYSKWPLKMIEELITQPHLLNPKPAHVTSYSESEWPQLAAFVERQVRSLSAKGAKGADAAVTAFLFLYTSILGLQPATVRVSSELPVGAGLGSSAAYCVALTTALLAYSREIELPQLPSVGEEVSTDRKIWFDVDEKKVDLVNKWAFEGERIIHGRPSGIDNTVSTYGYVVKFKKGQITRLHTQMPLRMLLTNTQVGRNTKALVAGVGERALRHPAAMGAIFKAIDEIAEEVVTILQTPPETARLGKSGEVVSSDECGPHPVAKTVQEIRLQELVDMNQGLLQGIGVSHLSIESICQITAAYRLSSKLTGAGGGGCVLTLLPHKLSSTSVELVKVDIEGKGFSCFEAVIGGNGVQVSCQAVS
ncbi:mevalonate kinase isoform X1 [Physcomitrium patens]|uniref:Mevalonate kinase n=1 Tax=Physcomitrium patens TaxID=3218 RepID=A0A2K1ILQ9_PHYPA|nr:mevalonate kinase-like [Physcomitrium patens]PNR30210.1 hypothetical protein PHYPA_026526 [Physcomitrium patens]|eukprot:XP_024360611.1 mevalonate kinase-like [Physcomitrella patens]